MVDLINKHALGMPGGAEAGGGDRDRNYIDGWVAAWKGLCPGEFNGTRGLIFSALPSMGFNPPRGC